MNFLPLGKLKTDMLDKLLTKNFINKDPRVILGPKVGEDAAVIDFGSKYLIAKTDPITFTTDEIGWYAVNVNANDIAVRGAMPKWFQASVLLPEGKTTKSVIEKIFSQIASACDELGITVIGGHTEVTYDLNRPIIIGCMLGEVEKEKLITTSGARVGDAIVITKGIVIEGTSVIASEKKDDLRKRGFSVNFINKAKNFIHTPGLSVLKDAQIAVKLATIHSLHDPTEGGLANGLFEIACASGVGAHIDLDAIPILEESKILCKEFGLDPLGTLTSGTLIITLPQNQADKLVDGFYQEGIKAAIIGEVIKSGLTANTGGKTIKLKHSERDEITKLF